MTDSEISHKLALAIGYSERDVSLSESGVVMVYRKYDPASHGYTGWRRFSYTDPTVIWPIAKHYKCFPYHSQFDRPSRQWAAAQTGKLYEAATPELAVALAVIGGAA